MGDPLFERRELVRTVHMDAKFLQRNIQASLLAQLRHKYEGLCVAEGYIQRKSITIADHSLGRTNLIKGGLDYTVRFQADVCFPHPGQVYRLPVTLKSKIGIHAEQTPIKALLPRDLHLGNVDFDTLKEKEEVDIEVVGARFQQGDDSIVVLGKLRTIVRPDLSVPAGEEEKAMEPLLAAAVPGAETGDGLKKVTVDVASAKAPDQAPRKRRVRLNPAGSVKNESQPEGAPQGTA